jgi:hypothetical protein
MYWATVLLRKSSQRHYTVAGVVVLALAAVHIKNHMQARSVGRRDAVLPKCRLPLQDQQLLVYTLKHGGVGCGPPAAVVYG